MTSDKSAPGAAAAFPNYFELFQNIASPFMGSGAANPASNAAALMLATLDPKEIERKTRELQTVLMWLKAQVGVVEMSIQTLEYQHNFLTKMAANPSPAHSTDGTSTPGETVSAPDLAELAKAAAAMNPALWAWNLLQQSAGNAATAPSDQTAPARAAAKPARKKAGVATRKRT